jgi:low temperature requirement protein LtrA
VSAETTSAASHGKVGWFELFYDLVIVAAVGYAAHTFAHHPTWALGLWIAAWTLIMYVLWLLTSLNTNLYPGDRPWRRILGLVQMLALVVAALGTVSDEGLSNADGFGGLALAFATVAAMYGMAARGGPSDRRDVLILAWSSAIAAIVLALGLLLPDDAEWTLTGWPTWIITIGVGIAAVPLFFGRAVGHLAYRIDNEHLGERLGQLVIIVLGEAFVSLVTALGGLSSIPNPVFFVLTFVVVFAIWTLYFSSVLPAGMPRSSGRLRAWLLTHWLLMFGAVGAAAGFSAVTLVPFGDEAAGTAVEWTTVPLVFVMLSLSLLTWLGENGMTRLVRLHAAATLALAVLAAVGLAVTAGGDNWEIALGSLIVVVDAALAAMWVRPYSVSSAAPGTRRPGSGP